MDMNLFACCLVVLLISLQIGRASTSSLRIDISPDIIIERIETVAHIACIPDGVHHWAHQVVVLEIFKDGDQPMAVMRANSKVVYGNTTGSRLQVKGIIHKKVSKTFLNLTLLNPEIGDSGIYSCVMYYLDESGMLKEARASDNLTVEGFDIPMLIKHLRDNMALLKQNLKDQDSMVGNHSQQITGLTDKDSNVEKRLVSLENETGNQSLQITGLMDKDSEMMTNLTTLEEITRNQTSDINSLTFEVTYTSRFSSTRNINFLPVVNQVVVFSDIIYQNGTDFNTITGIFTASRAGFYSFTLLVRMAYTNSWIYIDLKTNNKVEARLFARSSNDYGQSSISVTIPLAVGDQVKPVVMHMSGHNLLSFPYSMFSGHFVSRL